MRTVYLDIETSGFLPLLGSRVIEIAMIETVDSVLTGRYFHSYINPQYHLPEWVESITGLNNKFLSSMPTFGTLHKEIVVFLEGADAVSFNLPFDKGFVDSEFCIINANQCFDTLATAQTDVLETARALYPHEHNGMDNLCSRLFIYRSPSSNCLEDACCLFNIHQALLKPSIKR